MRTKLLNPSDGIYAASSDYVHGMMISGVNDLVFVSGTMGLDASGSPVPDVEGQLQLIWANIRRILAEAEMTTDNIVRLTSYLGDAAYAVANQDARIAALGSRRVPTTAIVTQLLDSSWLVEIEVVAAR